MNPAERQGEGNTMKTTRCKFKCHSVTDFGYGQEVTLHAEYDASLPEDVAFSTATPNAKFSAMINNPAVAGFFKPGAFYYVDITPAAERTE